MADGMENLIPFDKLTEDEQRELASLGGKKSAEARREKKRLREAAEAFLSATVKTDDGREIDRFAEAVGLLYKELKDPGGNRVGAFNALRDILGEKPKDEVGHSFDSEPTRISITFADKSKRKNYVEKDPVIIDGAALKDDRES